MAGLLKPNADLLSPVEIAYSPEPDAGRWMSDLLGAIERVFVDTGGTSLVTLAHTADYLGIPEPAVSRALGRAAHKAGFRTSTELARVAATFLGASRAEAPSLTPAERQVFDLVVRGLSNADIAALRQRSLSTVANQVATVLRKTGVPSRRALASVRLDDA